MTTIPRLRVPVTAMLLSLVAACSHSQPRYQGQLERTEPWSPEVVKAVGEIPLQNEGRVMPLSSLAAFSLYAAHGRRDVQYVTPDERGVDQAVKLSPTEWLLDVWCYPQQAANYPMFRIENVAVLGALEFPHDSQTSGFEYLSYAQLAPKGAKLQQLDKEYEKKPDKLRSETEGQVVQLFRQLIVLNNLLFTFSEIQSEIQLQGDELRSMFHGKDTIRLSDVLANAEAFRNFRRLTDSDLADPKHGNLAQVMKHVEEVIQAGGGPLFLPPTGTNGESELWQSIGDVTGRIMRGANEPKHIEMIANLQEGLLGADHAAKERGWLAYHDAVEAVAKQRADCATVGLESYYYHASWHFHAMMTFLLGFLIAVVCWALPRSRLLWWASMLCTGTALSLLILDITLRCMVTGHPPIARLYDTFLFIGGVSALTLMIAEFVMPRRIALALAPFLGMMMIFFARLFEVADGQDTMKPLQAVLLSNFWLAVHVPTINIGYASGLAAAIVAMTYIVIRVLRIDHPQSSLMKALVRTSYGIVCFSLATSVVGTILGGVWANDSWGRFWGWDTKENGALLICLSQIALLHARMSGYVRDAGFMLWAAGSGMVVLFSWFHVNLLGVGLHAYGFNSGLRDAVWTGYSVISGIVLIGGFDVWLRPNPAPLPVTVTPSAAAWPVSN